MLECNSPWLVNLVSTSRDDKNIYMLLEAVMGGELFAYLQVRYRAAISAAGCCQCSSVGAFVNLHGEGCGQRSSSVPSRSHLEVAASMQWVSLAAYTPCV